MRARTGGADLTIHEGSVVLEYSGSLNRGVVDMINHMVCRFTKRTGNSHRALMV